ncbi:RING-type domain-containing protein [Pseudoscourfieldia marina]
MADVDARSNEFDVEILDSFRRGLQTVEPSKDFKGRIRCPQCTKWFNNLGELFGHCKSIQELKTQGKRSKQHGATAIYVAIDLLKCRDATQSAVSRATCVRPQRAASSASASTSASVSRASADYSVRIAWPPMVLLYPPQEPSRRELLDSIGAAADVVVLYDNRSAWSGAALAVFSPSLDGYRAARAWEGASAAQSPHLILADEIVGIERRLRLPVKNQLRKKLVDRLVTLRDVGRMEEEEREAKRRKEEEEEREAERRRAEEEERIRKRKREEEEEEAARKRKREEEEAARKRKREEEEEAAARARECNVCFDEMEDNKRAVLSCGHAKTCYECALRQWNTTRECPECRQKIRIKPLRVYL